jgi:hypothetical protein
LRYLFKPDESAELPDEEEEEEEESIAEPKIAKRVKVENK